MKLLTESNTKIKKGETKGYKTFGIHLAPYNLSGKNVCSFASKGCAAACLNTAGMGVYSSVQKARIDKTKFFYDKKELFMTTLIKEIKSRIKSAQKNNMIPTFRLNLTSDLPWENIKFNDTNLMDMFPDIIFYDYTKSPHRMLSFLNGNFPKNYKLTFSRSESNDSWCDMIMSKGGNVAVVFRGMLPDTYKGKKVISGDIDDLRFLDPHNTVIGLIQKGLAKKDVSGFVVEA